MNTKEIAAEIRATLKRELPEWKFSVTIKGNSYYSAITIALMSGPEDVMVSTEHGSGYAQLNRHVFNDSPTAYGREWFNNGAKLTPKGWEVMSRANDIMLNRHWDRSDAQVDYFNCNFYPHLHIGKWDNGYKVVVK